MQSCLYTGRVRHRRFEPQLSEFRYAISFLYLDLDELDEVVSRLPLLTKGRFGVCSLRLDERLPMAIGCESAAQDVDGLRRNIVGLVETATGKPPAGPIRWLTLWGSFGMFFTPLSLYFCFAEDNGRLESIVAEVSNTPWRERHCYVLWSGNACEATAGATQSRFSYQHEKQFHVSPFLNVDMDYRWQLSLPSDSLSVHLEACRGEQPSVDATLNLSRTEITRSSWLRAVARYPVVPLRVLSAIYFEAFKLWTNKVPFFAHPQKRSAPDDCVPNDCTPQSERPKGRQATPTAPSAPSID